MPETVEIAIPVDANAAAALKDADTRAFIGEIVSRMLRQQTNEQLFDLIARLKADARARGLTDEIIDQELAAHKAERRKAGTHRAA